MKTSIEKGIFTEFNLGGLGVQQEIQVTLASDLAQTSTPRVNLTNILTPTQLSEYLRIQKSSHHEKK